MRQTFEQKHPHKQYQVQYASYQHLSDLFVHPITQWILCLATALLCLVGVPIVLYWVFYAS